MDVVRFGRAAEERGAGGAHWPCPTVSINISLPDCSADALLAELDTVAKLVEAFG